MFFAEWEEVGAFPHFTGVDRVSVGLFCPRAGGQFACGFPLAQIFRAVEKDTAAFFVVAAGYAEEPLLFVAEEEGVTEAGDGGVAGWFDDWLRMFFPGEQLWVFGSGEALCLAEIAVAVAEGGLVWRDRFYAGVKDCCGAVVVDGAAGEAAFGVEAVGSWCQGDGEMAPVDHVVADGVGPVHVAPDGGARVVLEKHVVVALPVDGPVGVVHPIFCGEKMELGAKWIGGEFLLEGVGRTGCREFRR